MATLAATFFFARPESLYIFAVECYLWLTGIGAPFFARKTYYSKFESYAKTKGLQVPGRQGFLCLYIPSAAAASTFLGSRLGYVGAPAFLQSIGLTSLASFLQPQDTGVRLWILGVALAVHFWKRVLEVAFIQHFSNKVDVGTVCSIGATYLSMTIHVLYTQYLSEHLRPAALNLTGLGVALYMVGIAGNFYHHLLLARLRKDGSKTYVVPRGGCFEWVACPHYTFELIEFWGIAMVAQTYVACAVAISTTLYLASRSRWTREWYIEKLEDYPERRTGLIPFLY